MLYDPIHRISWNDRQHLAGLELRDCAIPQPPALISHKPILGDAPVLELTLYEDDHVSLVGHAATLKNF
ncbi:hypothetical protein [Halomonas sp. S3-1-8]|uniref:hypothetical protein n=1 Tax=Halomonas sp. S3-1-8 TaxID=2986806 RepID=UPI0021F7BB5C|nr:hypothetical protein [Halomonas sp. S3-1-8]